MNAYHKLNIMKRFKEYIQYNKSQINELHKKIDALQTSNERQARIGNENLFASYFRDSIQNSGWVKNKSFSAYGGAANYSLLYKLYKIYDVIQPEKVLELGLGQSTKLTQQYLNHNKKAMAYVVDDSQEWIDIYRSQFDIPKNLELLKLKLRDFKYKGKTLQKNNEYAGLEKSVAGVKFNLVIVDGPIGYDKKYSRTNIISLSNNLATDFIIIFDDAERPGEQRTIQILKDELNAQKVKFMEFNVDAGKTQKYIVSHSMFNVAHHI